MILTLRSLERDRSRLSRDRLRSRRFGEGDERRFGEGERRRRRSGVGERRDDATTALSLRSTRATRGDRECLVEPCEWSKFDKTTACLTGPCEFVLQQWNAHEVYPHENNCHNQYYLEMSSFPYDREKQKNLMCWRA